MKTVAVVGLGLIGGSIVRKLQSSGYKLIGVSRSQETVDKVVKEGLVAVGSTNLSVAKDADVIFICTPINKTIPMIFEVHNIAKPEAVITDVASLKGIIIDFVNTNYDHVNFIGGHPMAGTEQKGIDASFEDLFVDAKWVLTPSKWVKQDDVGFLQKIVEQLGAKPIVADPDEHDKAVALISHMPLLLSQSLYGMVDNYPEKSVKELALKLAASGFRDMTRLTATNPELARDMLIENKTNVVSALQEVINEATKLQKELVENEDGFIQKALELAIKRKTMYSEDGKNLL